MCLGRFFGKFIGFLREIHVELLGTIRGLNGKFMDIYQELMGFNDNFMGFLWDFMGFNVTLS